MLDFRNTKCSVKVHMHLQRFSPPQIQNHYHACKLICESMCMRTFLLVLSNCTAVDPEKTSSSLCFQIRVALLFYSLHVRLFHALIKINQPINQSINQLINQSINQSITLILYCDKADRRFQNPDKSSVLYPVLRHCLSGRILLYIPREIRHISSCRRTGDWAGYIQSLQHQQIARVTLTS